MYTDGRLTETFVDEISGWSVTLSPFHVWDADYSAPTPDGRAEGPADVIARFESLNRLNPRVAAPVTLRGAPLGRGDFAELL